MTHQAFLDLITDLHRSIERVAEDLANDQPALAAALRRQAAWIPRPEDIASSATPRTGGEACASLRPLLYEALEEGVLEAREFDALMVGRLRAARALGSRRP